MKEILEPNKTNIPQTLNSAAPWCVSRIHCGTIWLLIGLKSLTPLTLGHGTRMASLLDWIYSVPEPVLHTCHLSGISHILTSPLKPGLHLHRIKQHLLEISLQGIWSCCIFSGSCFGILVQASVSLHSCIFAWLKNWYDVDDAELCHLEKQPHPQTTAASASLTFMITAVKMLPQTIALRRVPEGSIFSSPFLSNKLGLQPGSPTGSSLILKAPCLLFRCSIWDFSSIDYRL